MSDTAPTTVLIVEDEVMIRMDLVETLQAAGFQTHEAGDSAEAIRILEKHPEIRVVFTDIQMPGDMDGLALSHYVRDRWPPTIIVVCSANELPSLDVMPSEASFMPKPYAAGALGKMLETIGTRLSSAGNASSSP